MMSKIDGGRLAVLSAGGRDGWKSTIMAWYLPRARRATEQAPRPGAMSIL
jgi:hypothetical protein